MDRGCGARRADTAFGLSRFGLRLVERLIAANCRAVHAANVREAVAADGAVDKAAVIPHQKITVLSIPHVDCFSLFSREITGIWNTWGAAENALRGSKA